MTDQDGNIYKTAEIDSRIWMAENYRRATGRHFNPVEGSLEDYGLFYDFETIAADDFCPEGWRIPKQADFEALLRYAELKKTSETAFLSLIAKSPLWITYPNQGADEFSFGALLAGALKLNPDGDSNGESEGDGAYFWTFSKPSQSSKDQSSKIPAIYRCEFDEMRPIGNNAEGIACSVR